MTSLPTAKDSLSDLKPLQKLQQHLLPDQPLTGIDIDDKFLASLLRTSEPEEERKKSPYCKLCKHCTGKLRPQAKQKPCDGECGAEETGSDSCDCGDESAVVETGEPLAPPFQFFEELPTMVSFSEFQPLEGESAT